MCSMCMMHRLEELSPPYPSVCSTCESVWLCPSCAASGASRLADHHHLVCKGMWFARYLPRVLATFFRKITLLAFSSVTVFLTLRQSVAAHTQ